MESHNEDARIPRAPHAAISRLSPKNELVFVQNAKSQTPECGIYHHLHTINPCYVLQDFMRLSSLAAAALSGC